MQASRTDPAVATALDELESLVVNLRILGCYPSAQWSSNPKS
jgi:hypothetical protein